MNGLQQAIQFIAEENKVLLNLITVKMKNRKLTEDSSQAA